MENKLETTIMEFYWGYIGTMENKMEATILRYILGIVYWVNSSFIAH